MGDRQFDPSEFLKRSTHPSAPFRWVAEHATNDAILWALELSEIERHCWLIELASRGPIAELDGDALAQFAALLVVAEDRRAVGLD